MRERWDAGARRIRAAGPPRAVHPGAAADFPASRSSFEAVDYAPQLATLVEGPPEGDDWLHELKYDGYRLGCGIARTGVELTSRRGNDWTRELPEIAAAARELSVREALVDGEVCVVLDDGRTSFQSLQRALAGGSRHGLSYFCFDLLQLDGRDLRRGPLERRKEELRRVLEGAPAILRYADHWIGRGRQVFQKACSLGFEGIVSKRRSAPYQAGRGGGWLKSKCIVRQEFVVGGFTLATGDPDRIGALLVGYWEGSRLVFAGKVGTGYTRALARELRARLAPLERRECPFDPPPPGWLRRNAHWVRPELVAEVTFTEWTEGGQIRHPSFKGLREDKPVREVTREVPRASASRRSPSSPVRLRGRGPSERPVVAGVPISHPERVVLADAALTKLDLARYQESVASWSLPHLRGRPLTVVRCAGEIGAGCSFMKHSKVWAPAALRRVRIPEKTKLGEYLVADTVEAVVALAQMDVVEIHTWNTRVEHVEQPDRLVLDLDPGDEVPFAAVVQGGRLLREALRALGLESWVKTTGGRGLHVVAPIVPERDWSECLAFARSLAEAVARDYRSYTTAYARAGRDKLILIDYLRNNRTNTSIAAFSPRARPGAPVSTPIAWDELAPGLDPFRFTVRTVPQRLARLRSDPWAGYFRSRQRLSAAALRAAEALARGRPPARVRRPAPAGAQ